MFAATGGSGHPFAFVRELFLNSVVFLPAPTLSRDAESEERKQQAVTSR
jgi:hypothetical protein